MPVLAAAGSDIALALTEIGGVLLALGVVSRVAHRLRASPVPGFLAVGVVLGLLPGPLTLEPQTIELGAAVGVVLLLFFIGLEYTGDELVETLREHRVSGVVDAVLNALPGLAVGLLLGMEAAAAFALAGITWISSSGIVARTLDDLGRLGNRETPSVLSILVIEDLAMAVYLPLLTVALAGGSAVTAVTSLAVALSVVAVVMVFALRGGERASRLLDTEREEALLLSILGLTLFVAGIAEQLQVSSAVGAFLVGIAVSGTVADRTKQTLAPIRDLFAAAFFVFFGLQIDFDGLPDVLGPIAVLVLLGVAGKVATGWYAAHRAGTGVPGRVRAGTALIARGEFSIVLASLAVAAGVDDRLGPLAAGYVLVAAIAGTILTRFADPIADRLAAPTR